MSTYEKPLVMVNDDLAEGVYAASGAPGCDSKYMKGEWEKGDYSSKDIKTNQGCNGCPAYTGTACGLTTHYVDSNYAASYDVDNGNRMPTWEKQGKKPDDPAW